MSEPETGARHIIWRRVKAFLAVIGGIVTVAAAVVTILAFGLGLKEKYEIIDKDRYDKLLELEEQYKQKELISPVDCPEPPPPVSAPEPDRATILTAAIDELIQQAGFLAKYVEDPGFKDRFDRWRSNAKSKLADGQKLISDLGWTNNEDWVETFHSQTHIKRDLGREPYRPEEYRGFLESGSQILERMKREVAVHSVKETSPAGGISPLES